MGDRVTEWAEQLVNHGEENCSKGSKPQNQRVWFTIGGYAWIGNLFAQKKNVLLLINFSRRYGMFVTVD
jgi:hypothetical protein